MDKNNTLIKNGKERNEKGQFVYCNQASVGHGRPKNIPSIPNMIKTIGNEIPEGETKTRFELMSLKLWKMALKGNIRAIELICNRLEGRPAQQIKIIEPTNTESPFAQFKERLAKQIEKYGDEYKEFKEAKYKAKVDEHAKRVTAELEANNKV